MLTKELHRTAANVERFLTMIGIPDDAGRTSMEEELVSRMSADGAKKPFLVHSQKSIFLYNNNIVVKSFAADSSLTDQVLQCDCRKISILDRQAYQQGGNILVIGAAAAALGAGGIMAGDAEARRRAQSSGGVDISCNNNNNNNNNNG